MEIRKTARMKVEVRRSGHAHPTGLAIRRVYLQFDFQQRLQASSTASAPAGLGALTARTRRRLAISTRSIRPCQADRREASEPRRRTASAIKGQRRQSRFVSPDGHQDRQQGQRPGGEPDDHQPLDEFGATVAAIAVVMTGPAFGANVTKTDRSAPLNVVELK